MKSHSCGFERHGMEASNCTETRRKWGKIQKSQLFSDTGKPSSGGPMLFTHAVHQSNDQGQQAKGQVTLIEDFS